MRFFKERLELIRDSELEQNNEEILKFSWPSEVNAILDNENEAFHGSLYGIMRVREEVRLLLKTETGHAKKNG